MVTFEEMWLVRAKNPDDTVTKPRIDLITTSTEFYLRELLAYFLSAFTYWLFCS